MKIHLKPTKASIERRKELQSKIEGLLAEYHDVPIFVAHKLTFSDSKDEIMLDFDQGKAINKKQMHIVEYCTLLCRQTERKDDMSNTAIKFRKGNTATSRRCTYCKVGKALSDFERDRSRPLGLSYRCIDCVNKRSQSERYKQIRRKSQRKYYETKPEASIAHSLAGKNKDKLKKKACEECGATEKLHMHHPDHSKPLEVITLCNPCHLIVHHGVRV